MPDELNRQRVIKYLDAFYAGDIDVATACCDEEIDSITYAPVELFPHLGTQARQGCGSRKRSGRNKPVIPAENTNSSSWPSTAIMLRRCNSVACANAAMTASCISKPRSFFQLRAGRILVHPLVFRLIRFRPATARPGPDRFLCRQRPRHDATLTRAFSARRYLTPSALNLDHASPRPTLIRRG